MKEIRKVGTLLSWTASPNGGFGLVECPDGSRFFLHRSFVKVGEPRPGSKVSFQPMPPAKDKKHPRAYKAVLDNDSAESRATKLPEVLGGSAVVDVNHVAADVSEARRVLGAKG